MKDTRRKYDQYKLIITQNNLILSSNFSELSFQVSKSSQFKNKVILTGLYLFFGHFIIET
jgi:hypothetical protein